VHEIAGGMPFVTVEEIGPGRPVSSTVTNGIPPAISCTSRTRARLATRSH